MCEILYSFIQTSRLQCAFETIATNAMHSIPPLKINHHEFTKGIGRCRDEVIALLTNTIGTR